MEKMKESDNKKRYTLCCYCGRTIKKWRRKALINVDGKYVVRYFCGYCAYPGGSVSTNPDTTTEKWLRGVLDD